MITSHLYFTLDVFKHSKNNFGGDKYVVLLQKKQNSNFLILPDTVSFKRGHLELRLAGDLMGV